MLTTREPVHFVTLSIVPLVDTFRTLQGPEGNIVRNIGQATQLLKQLCLEVRTACSLINAPASHAKAFETDVEQWLTRGLMTVPSFDCSVASYMAPLQDTFTFFIAPAILTNGPTPRGAFLECFLAYHDEQQVTRSSLPPINHSYIPMLSMPSSSSLRRPQNE